MSVSGVFLMPHAPVLIDKIGGDDTNRVLRTVEGMRRCAKNIKALSPDVIVLISPHGPVFSDAVALYDLEPYKGDFKAFGEHVLSYEFDKHYELMNQLEYENQVQKGRYYAVDETIFKRFQHEPSLDHGALVPLHFLRAEMTLPPILIMSYGTLSYQALINHGKLLKRAVEALKLDAVVIASGDMSHALSNYGPYAFHESGQWFDARIQTCITDQKPFDIFLEPAKRIQEACECGLRSLALALGTLTDTRIQSTSYAYEAPFGVGYLCAGFYPEKGTPQFELFQFKADDLRQRALSGAHDFVRIARKAIESQIQGLNSNALELKSTALKNTSLYETLINKKAGVFVSLHDASGLRGCMGTYVPSCETLFKEICHSAKMAAAEDPRFDPVEEDELSDLCISVDIVSPLELVGSVGKLDPKRYGVLVVSKGKKGLLLPDLEGITTPEEQLKVASNKAGFSVDKIEQIFRFTVERYA